MASEYLKRLAQRSRERREEDENVVRSVTPVSYTHLDVYKRQRLHHRRQRPALQRLRGGLLRAGGDDRLDRGQLHREGLCDEERQLHKRRRGEGYRGVVSCLLYTS